jgi:phosphatidylserine/phosphatidylglycerophosphate/cardiolipin synthase-like enzyme
MQGVSGDYVAAFNGFRFQLQFSGAVFEGLLIGVGFLGALFLVHWLRWLGRRIWPEPQFRCYFSPKGGCTKAIVAELNAARSEVLVQAFSFTYDPIVDALVAAHKRGVRVQILLDKANEAETYSDLKRVLEFGLDTLIDADHAIAHNKIMLIDQKVIITGSFNFTQQAEANNAENVLIIRGHQELIVRYRLNFMEHRAHSRKAQPRPESGTTDKGRRAA